MLYNGHMKESAANVPIELSDVSHTVFLKILEFLYTDTVSDVSLDLGIHLMVTSELFMLDRLKGICEDIIRNEINVDNVVNILIASHQHNAFQLKEITLEYMLRNLSHKKIQAGLKKDLREEPDLLIEIIQLTSLQQATSPQHQANGSSTHQAERSLQRQQGQQSFPGMNLHHHNQQQPPFFNFGTG
jgi:hypothetical protein